MLADALGRVHALEILNLNENEVSDEGLIALMKALPLLKGLKSIALDGNGITEHAAEALTLALP